jgi:hypothetical protein
MSDIRYYITEGAAGGDTITVFDPSRDNPVLIATSRHPHYARIREGLAAGDESVLDYFDIAEGVRKAFEQITDRVSWDGTNILWDGEVVHNTLADHMTRVLESGADDYRPLALFWEKLAANPVEHSREQAFDWLASHNFVITEDGDVVGYKGVATRTDAVSRNRIIEHDHLYAKDVAISTRQGHAFVDGVEFQNSYIPNPVGAVVSMPRNEVMHDPNAACHTGLHIGDWGFGSAFAGERTLRVTFSPAHIVSVPGAASKVRVCQYKVEEDWVKNPATDEPVLRNNEQAWVPDVSVRV